MPLISSGYLNNCFGTYTFADGDKYVGEVKDNKKHGQGTYTYANGDKYVGEYKDGKINGQGTFTSADGDKYFGEWKEDKSSFISDVADARGFDAVSQLEEESDAYENFDWSEHFAEDDFNLYDRCKRTTLVKVSNFQKVEKGFGEC